MKHNQRTIHGKRPSQHVLLIARGSVADLPNVRRTQVATSQVVAQ